MVDSEEIDDALPPAFDENGNVIPEGEPGSASNPEQIHPSIEIKGAEYQPTNKTTKEPNNEADLLTAGQILAKTIEESRQTGGLRFYIGGHRHEATGHVSVRLTLTVDSAHFDKYWQSDRRPSSIYNPDFGDTWSVNGETSITSETPAITLVAATGDFPAIFTINPADFSRLWFYSGGIWNAINLPEGFDEDHFFVGPIIRSLTERREEYEASYPESTFLRPWGEPYISGTQSTVFFTGKDPQTLRHGTTNPDEWQVVNGIYTHENKRTAFTLEMIGVGSSADNWEIEHFKRLCEQQGPDCIHVINYVLSALYKRFLEDANLGVRGKFRLDDIIDAINLPAWTPADLRESRKQVWRHITFVALAWINGKKDNYEKPKINKEYEKLTIHAPIWLLRNLQHPEVKEGGSTEDANKQGVLALPGETVIPWGNPDLVVDIEINEDFLPWLTGKNAQYLSGAECISAINTGQGKQTTSATARAAMPVIAEMWRMYGPSPDERHQLTRRQILASVGKRSPIIAAVKGKNPQRGLEYWHKVLEHLSKKDGANFLSTEKGESSLSIEAVLAQRPQEQRGGIIISPYKWQDLWLDQKVKLLPSDRMLKEIIDARGKQSP